MFISESDINSFLNAKESMKCLNLGIYSYRQTNNQSMKGKYETSSGAGNRALQALALGSKFIWLQESNS